MLATVYEVITSCPQPLSLKSSASTLTSVTGIGIKRMKGSHRGICHAKDFVFPGFCNP
jgi:hypothetical protein